MNSIEKIAEIAVRDAISSLAEKMIKKNAGYGVDNEIKLLIKEEATLIIKNNPELKNLLKERIQYWIQAQ